jgi:pseudouridine kinase
MKKVLVIGAQNIDLYARSMADLKLHDSNRSTIEIAFGGVACNIATNLSILGNEISFLTAFGEDHFGSLALKNLEKLRIGFSESRMVESVPNSIYLGIMDKNNDLFIGLNDMELINHLDVAFFMERSKYIDGFDILIIDNNLNIDALEYLLIEFTNKIIIMDTVSAQKAKKLERFLPYIDVLKVNLLELKAISVKEKRNDMLDELINRGLGSIILTNSDKEIIYKSKLEEITINPVKVSDIVNATGAGDAFLSGFIHSYIRDESIEQCLEIAKQVAYRCLSSPIATINNR